MDGDWIFKEIGKQKINMKNKLINSKWVIIAIFLTIISYSLHAQGTIDFDSGYWYQAPTSESSYYKEKGFLFQVDIPTLGTDNSFWIAPAGQLSGIPYNPTAFLGFYQYNSPDDYVALNQTSGDSFGLTSVQLAAFNLDLNITFVGTKADGSPPVYQTFDISARTSWKTCYFDSDFASGLVDVDIYTSSVLFMDNLTFIPEPTTITLLTFGFLAGFQAFRKRRQ